MTTRSIEQRLDEILIDPDDEDKKWSSTRVFLTAVLVVFLALSFSDPVFRDTAAFVTIILALLAAVVAPKVLDLRLAIGQAAAAIGRKFSSREETVETGMGSVTTTESESVATVDSLDEPPPITNRDDV